ncbi:B12-binding domain-containing radical SAM protein [Leptospira sp. GIMC2001]|uniref:B12-binding domain-containing radical SAM protein n=1 Tax=Leptospira sp. GIMC2001 TaxID=1513297 RepID=UPI00234A7651|nr:radical SAM protein [Leptospira sp. GIMC2001]WCL49171.1 radical SAM protein [Leptospira sp. GIMC2001]
MAKKIMTEAKVLVVTGSFLVDHKSTAKSFIVKQFAKFGFDSHQWLEHRIKTIIAEVVLAGEIKKIFLRKTKEFKDQFNDFFNKKNQNDSPYLTEVILTTLLEKEQIQCTSITLDEIFLNQSLFSDLLEEHEVVFISSTYLKDLGELKSIIKLFKTKHNRLVIGGALAGSIYKYWEGEKDLDILAIGYGEYLVPAIAEWIRSSFKEIHPPKNGRIVRTQHSIFLFSGVPDTLSLDKLTVPNWALSEVKNNRKFNLIYYESVRGCPYRCAFCNYPFLFDDTKFRMKSAEKIFEDWKYYINELNIEFIVCLDSLFTMPKQRLVKLCNLIIGENLKIKWTCYARADDLCDETVVLLLKEAGCIQVQIGIESGDPTILKNMNKKLGIEKNHLALSLCRKHGLTTVASIIVGFPGENKDTIYNTLNFLKKSPPDFIFVAVFSVRIREVPILSEINRNKFNLKIIESNQSMSPYWKHETMDCYEAVHWTSFLVKQLILNKISLDAALFQKEMLYYDSTMREALLDFQKSAWNGRFISKIMFKILNFVIDHYLRRDLRKSDMLRF